MRRFLLPISRMWVCFYYIGTPLSIVIKYQLALYNVFEVEIEKYIYELRLEAYRAHKELYIAMVIYG